MSIRERIDATDDHVAALKERVRVLQEGHDDLLASHDRLESIVHALATSLARVSGIGRLTGNALFVGGQSYEFSDRFKSTEEV